MKEGPVVTIDGPPGSGKTTVSKSIAKALGFKLIDTGAMYRAASLLAIRENVPLDDALSLGKLLKGASIDFAFAGRGNRIVVNGEDVEEQIRSEEMGMKASEISKVTAVREILVEKQREMGAKGRVVCEGRDASTVIFPDAECKFFLDAQVHKRAERRYRELVTCGSTQTFRDIYEEMIARDIQDSTREHSPLKLAHGVRYVDTTALSCEDVTGLLIGEIEKSAR